METSKATHTSFNRELFAPVMKECEGKYIAILSDTSVDRDGEMMGKSALMKVESDIDYIAGLIDHDNKVLNQVCQWVNKRIVKLNDHTVLVAEPKFFMSNPNAVIIKGMLDEGAQIGISIGAIVKDYKDETYEGKTMRTFTDIELLEASFVAIPSNRHGKAMAVAKSYKLNEEKKVEITQKDIDSAVEKKSEELKSEFTKQLESKDTEINKLKKELEDSEKAIDDQKAETAKVEEEKVEAEKKLAEAVASIEKQKAMALEKKNLADGDDLSLDKSADVDAELKKGKLPFMRI